MSMTPIRLRTLRHIAAINAGGHSARCPNGEMIREAEACIADGLAEWRPDRHSFEGRWLTDAGLAVLATAEDRLSLERVEAPGSDADLTEKLTPEHQAPNEVASFRP